MKQDINHFISRDLSEEFIIKTSRSSGAGGQNVNKVNTKVELRFHIAASQLLTEDEKHGLLIKLAKKISSEGFLVVTSQISRSQLKNKEDAIEKCYRILNKALIPKKKRKPTRLGRAAKAKRLGSKRIRGEKKERRNYRMKNEE
jgi:ribosome-associated protein